MKPDWKDAPEWARWLAMDPSGTWWWFREEPIYSKREGGWMSQFECQIAIDWVSSESSLESRP